jgi:hypothetical protein
MAWTLDGMTIRILDRGQEVMRIGLGEAIESTDRALIEGHLREIERTPWLSKWHAQDKPGFPYSEPHPAAAPLTETPELAPRIP